MKHLHSQRQKTWKYPFVKSYSEMFPLVSSAVKAQHILLELNAEKLKYACCHRLQQLVSEVKHPDFPIQPISEPSESLSTVSVTAWWVYKGDPTALTCDLI